MNPYAGSANLWKEKEQYLNQLAFVNKKVEGLIDEILSKSEIPPIILLQGDHGSASTFGDSNSADWDGVDWEHPTEIMLRERMRILNAYYLPGQGSALLYDSITPVNTFRLIFNSYFDSNYQLLDDRSYYSNYERPYKFVDVTDTVKHN